MQKKAKRDQNNAIAVYFDTKWIFRCVFGQWRRRFDQELEARMIIEAEQAQVADQNAMRHVPKVFFRKWRQYIQIVKQEKWRETRLSVLRNCAKGILGDSNLEHAIQTTSISLNDLIA
jgi:hypothetical protein